MNHQTARDKKETTTTMKTVIAFTNTCESLLVLMIRVWIFVYNGISTIQFGLMYVLYSDFRKYWEMETFLTTHVPGNLLSSLKRRQIHDLVQGIQEEVREEVDMVFYKEYGPAKRPVIGIVDMKKIRIFQFIHLCSCCTSIRVTNHENT